MLSTIKRKIKRIARIVLIDKLQPNIWRLCVRWSRLADVYYCFSSHFRREHRAVLLGKLLHMEDNRATDEAGAGYTLRRNIHRLEKGLIMRPRRPIFAADYIGETVDIYIRSIAEQQTDIKPLLFWAHDVLTEYFKAVTSGDPKIDAYRKSFQESKALDRTSKDMLIPYNRETTPLHIEYQEMMALAKRRRSVRWYLDKPVPRKIIDQAIEVAKLSPSACNRQPFSFRIFDDNQLAKQIGAIPMGTRGFSDNFPCTIVIIGDLRAYFHERDRHVIYVDAGLAAMALQFALEIQGVGSCCINWPDIHLQERNMSKTLNLTPNQRPVMCLSLGYPDPEGRVPYSQKKSLDEIRSYNQL